MLISTRPRVANISERVSELIIISSMVLIIVGIFSGLRKVYITPYSYYFGQYSDFLTLMFYLADIGIIILTASHLLSYLSQRMQKSNIKTYSEETRQAVSVAHHVTYETWIARSLFVIILFNPLIHIAYHGINGIQMTVWQSVVILMLISIYLSSDFHKYIRKWAKTIACLVSMLGAIVSVLALIQFTTQQSIGLPFHMEPIFSPLLPNIAKIWSTGELFVRPYATFPHPNILAGALIPCIYAGLWLYTGYHGRQSISQKSRLNLRTLSGERPQSIFSRTDFIRHLIPFLSLLITVCLSLTFSRVGLTALATGMTLIAGFALARRGVAYKKQALLFCTSIIVMLVAAWLILFPLSQARIPRWHEPAISERVFYNEIGLKMTKDNWLLGIGIGQSLLHMEHYADRNLTEWEHQPIHNYFILLAAELGIPALVAFIGLIVALAVKLVKRVRNEQMDAAPLIGMGLLISLIVLMMGDHYLYTIRQGQLFLWGSLIAISIVANKQVNPALEK